MNKLIILIALWLTSVISYAIPLQKLTVVLNELPNSNHAPLIIAKEQGFFKEEGLDVKLIAPFAPHDAIHLIAAKKADIGITSEPVLMMKIDKGLPLICIGTLLDDPLKGTPHYSELIFIANKTTVDNPSYPHFLIAIKRAVRYIDEYPEHTWNMFVKAYPNRNNASNQESWFVNMPYFAEDPAYLQEEEWLNFAKFMAKNGLITTVSPISTYAIVIR